MTHLNELYLILSKALPIKCLPQSFYRRMQRFFAGQYFDYRQISQLIFNMFSFD
ncbi:IS4 family transposase, partial [Acinetobacter baumannii]|nr:IS4 family transposase [Acinetobacter baumannii]MBD0062072.1 IS4 family transposase [Acinetobacter baumannii]MBD0175748.1 IS4 family transposase [Acinetobacter baumannii]MBD0183224.1 IS4 family transposase [Acinetobacter baumannii]MBD0214391.1 IS4 family transposase [Acinetobacter baumannii]